MKSTKYHSAVSTIKDIYMKMEWQAMHTDTKISRGKQAIETNGYQGGQDYNDHAIAEPLEHYDHALAWIEWGILL